MDQHKIRIKIGDHEFDAEGSEKVIAPMAHAFIAAVAKALQENKLDVKAATSTTSTNRLTAQWWQHIPFEFDRLYDVADDTVALKIKPPIGFDALILLVYGVQVIANLKRQPSIDASFLPDTEESASAKASNLIVSARRSGIDIDRLDRLIMLSVRNVREQLVLRHGSKKGSYYCLSPKGREYAEQIALRLLYPSKEEG
jgi:hypothetical protein